MGNTAITKQERAAALYMSSEDITLEQVADKLSIPYETVRDWSRDGSWSVKRGIVFSLSQHPDDIVQQAKLIRLRLFDEIVSGQNRAAEDLVDLARAWKSLVGIVGQEEETFDREKILESIDETD